ncbi:ubiquitin-conjugating enzyme/RWD-like protein, partial [Chytridium lagenaria]
FQRYELLIEYKNLRNPNHCPPGMYIKPHPDDLHEWHGVLFIHRGYYKEGVFKFVMTIPDGYPEEGPSVRFVTDMFHPLIDNRDGLFSLRQQFPQWRAHKDYLCHVLHYIKNSFKEAVMANLEGVFFTERPLFAKLAAQCAQLSASEGIVFDNDGPHGEENAGESLVRFAPLTDDEFRAKKNQMLSFVAVSCFFSLNLNSLTDLTYSEPMYLPRRQCRSHRSLHLKSSLFLVLRTLRAIYQSFLILEEVPCLIFLHISLSVNLHPPLSFCG